MTGPAANPAGSGAGPRFLIVAATAGELDPLRAALGPAGTLVPPPDFLCCGVGPTAAAAALAACLAPRPEAYAAVIMAGVAGAYPPLTAPAPGDSAAASAEPPHPGLLDICLAQREVLGDFGVAAGHGAEPFGRPELDAGREFSLDSPLLQEAVNILRRLRIPFHCGTFVTVNAASATLERGRALARRHHGLCENMEGAAAALVCRNFQRPLLELRCVSNMVEDRDPGRWRLAEAIRANTDVLGRLLPELAAAWPGSARSGPNRKQ
jgi:futalosine hydrolase